MKHKRSLMSIGMATIMLVSLCAIVSTAGVNAASSSANAITSKPISTSVRSSTNTKTFAGIAGAPAGIVGDPAVCSQQGTNKLDLFIRGTDNATWWRHWSADSGWSAWKSLGGILTSSPGATSPVSGQLYVAVRGTNGALYSKNTPDGGASWSGWSNLGGQLLAGTGPAVVYNGTAIKYAVIGTNHALYWWSLGSWTNLGGYLTSSPGATFSNTGVAIAARGNNGALYETSPPDGGTIYGWFSRGGQILAGTGPALVDQGGNTKYFVIGTNHQLYLSIAGWPWTSLGGNATSSPAATSRDYGVIDVFVRGTNGALYSKNTTDYADSWSPWYQVPG